MAPNLVSRCGIRQGLRVVRFLLMMASVPVTAGIESSLESRSLDARRPVERLAFGSCFKVPRGGRIWEAVAAQDPDVFLFLGDTLYPDEKRGVSDPPALAAAYEALAEDAGFRHLRQRAAVLPMWDDHDYGMNDGGADYRYRETSEALFEEAWNLPTADPRRQRPGVYFSRILGEGDRRLQLIVLDTRYFRSPLRVTDRKGARGRERYLPDDDPDKTLLGDAQWSWLEEQLQEPVDLRIIASSIQVLADGHGWEGWRLLPRERERLMNLLRQHDTATTLLLSGDRHVAGFYHWDGGLREPLLEFTSSALNNTIPFPYRRSTLAEAGPRRLGDLYGAANFGTVEIDWDRRQIALVLRDANGSEVRREERAMRTPGP